MDPHEIYPVDRVYVYGNNLPNCDAQYVIVGPCPPEPGCCVVFVKHTHAYSSTCMILLNQWITNHIIWRH